MSGQQRTLPDPSWYGSPGDVVEQWLRYIAIFRRRSTQEEPARLRQQIRSATDEVGIYRREINDAEAYLATIGQQVQELRERIASGGPDFDAIAAEILALPFVVASRVDNYGRLAILVRPTRSDGKDIGDFELSFQSFKPRWYSSYMTWSRTTENVIHNVQFENIRKEDFLPGSNRTMCRCSIEINEGRLTGLRESYQYIEVIKHFVQRINRISDNAHILPNVGSNTLEPVYEDHVVNPGRALERLHHGLVGESDVERLASLETLIEHKEAQINRYRQGIRTNQQNLRQLNSALEKLERLANAEIVLSDEDAKQAKRQLRFITTGIPGVMGMRFAEDGTPVVHVRSSFAHHGARYDFGDYELYLCPRLDSGQFGGWGVVPVSLTRRPANRWLSPYLALYGREGELDAGSWFCFGGRSPQLARLMQAGNFDHAVNVMVNSLNGVNREDLAFVMQNATQMPIDEVWHNAPRRRPRRRTLQDIGQVAIATTS
ncbi:hypothetical protein EOL96_00205 [Candidatus Saccharibacteria bacterium]|nr:hypothetical protein [Candidatus Saccharibacteria bacterium]